MQLAECQAASDPHQGKGLTDQHGQPAEAQADQVVRRSWSCHIGYLGAEQDKKQREGKDWRDGDWQRRAV